MPPDSEDNPPGSTTTHSTPADSPLLHQQQHQATQPSAGGSPHTLSPPAPPASASPRQSHSSSSPRLPHHPLPPNTTTTTTTHPSHAGLPPYLAAPPTLLNSRPPSFGNGPPPGNTTSGHASRSASPWSHLPPPPPPPPGSVPQDSRTQLMISNLPFRVRWQDLKDLMRRVGTVLRADVALTPSDGRSRGFGVVLFQRAEDAAKAIEVYHGFSWQTRVLDVRIDTQDPRGELALAEANRQNAMQQHAQQYQLAAMQQHPPWPAGIPMPPMFPPPPMLNGGQHQQHLVPPPPPPPMPIPLSNSNNSHSTSSGSVNGSPNLAAQLRPGTSDDATQGSPATGTSTTLGTPPLTHLGSPSPSAPLNGNASDAGDGTEASRGRSELTAVNGGGDSRTATPSGEPGRQQFPHPSQQPHPTYGMMMPQMLSMGGGGGGYPGMSGPPPVPGGLMQYYQQQQQQRSAPTPVPAHYVGRHLFVGNLPFNCQWQELKDLMRSAGGSVLRADIAQGPDGRSRGFGSVLFSSAQDAERAVQMFNGYEYNGRALKVHFDKFSTATTGQGSPGGPYGQPHSYGGPAPPMPFLSHGSYDHQRDPRSQQHQQQPFVQWQQQQQGGLPRDFHPPTLYDRQPPRNVIQQYNEGPHRDERSSTPSADHGNGEQARTNGEVAPPSTSSQSKIGEATSNGHRSPAAPPSRIAMPPPFPFAGPLSPMHGRLPPMTPSMPAFTLGAFPQTPPLFPSSFFSPGLGPFSPQVGSPYFGPGHYMNGALNAAPGAPVHRQHAPDHNPMFPEVPHDPAMANGDDSSALHDDDATPPATKLSSASALASSSDGDEPSYFPPVAPSSTSSSSASPSISATGPSSAPLSPETISTRPELPAHAHSDDISINTTFGKLKLDPTVAQSPGWATDPADHARLTSDANIMRRRSFVPGGGAALDIRRRFEGEDQLGPGGTSGAESVRRASFGAAVDELSSTRGGLNGAAHGANGGGTKPKFGVSIW